MKPWHEPVRRLFTEQDEAKVIAAIRTAESETSGEIRVHVEQRSAGSALRAARAWFHRLGMERTRERNGVLFYYAIDDRVFAVVGGEGIHAQVGDVFWEGLRDLMLEGLAQGDAATGLAMAIEEAGVRLAQHFPRRRRDVNELPDEISYQ